MQWRFYDRQTNVAKQRAMERLQIITEVESLIAAGMCKSGAVQGIARIRKRSAATIWSWLSLVKGISRHDQLAYLTPEFRGGGKLAEIDKTLFLAVASDYLRLERPSWAECIRRLQALAEQRGVQLPHSRTIRRRLFREFDRTRIARMRGEELPFWLNARVPAND